MKNLDKNLLMQDTSVKKRKRFKIPCIKVTLKNNKAVYENNRTVYEDSKNKR
jgi:hypothetical protein